MTYPVPEYPLYVDGAFYPAAIWRQFDGGTSVQDAGNAAAVSPAGGVFGDPGSSMLVTPGGGMSVTVNAGYCSVPNSSGSGAYRFGLMQQAILEPITAPGSGTRLDYVIASVTDAGSGSASQVAYLTGTTSPPALPANAIRLAEVAVPSTASSITSGMITDLRGFVAAPGCIIPVASASVAPSGPTGQLFLDVEGNQLLYSPVTEVTQTLTGSGDWACPPFVTSVAARAVGGGAGGTGITSGSPGSATFRAGTSWTAPAGVTAVSVQAWGAGGSGGGSEYFYYTTSPVGPPGGGGGGGGYSSGTVPVTPGNSYTVTVGAGGAQASGAASGNSGGGSSFTGDDGPGGTPEAISAGGGQRGFSSSAGNGGQGGSGGSGTFPGGSGATRNAGSYDGGGGGGAGGAGGGGQSASTPSGGSGGPGGGAGGTGGNTGNAGGAGSFPGGGGGGSGLPSLPAQYSGTSAGTSGAGAGGQVILSWTPDSSGGGGGGGGEEAYEPAIAVTANHPYPYAVGTGGGDSANGTATSFTGDSKTLLANPGQATSQSATGGAGGTGSMNTQHFDGGTGGTGSAGTGVNGWGGGGGASGSSTGTGNAGGDATTTTAGTGGTAGPYGGAGGAGGGGNGKNGAAPGGGGGGSSGPSLGYHGGTGGPGSLVLSYTVAPGAIPYLVASGPSWYEYDASETVTSVSVTITADGTSDYEITARAANTGPASTGPGYGTLQILDGSTLIDSVSTLASTGGPAGVYNTGWTYFTSGEQGTTPSAGSHTIEFTSSGVTLAGPAFIRVTRVAA